MYALAQQSDDLYSLVLPANPWGLNVVVSVVSLPPVHDLVILKSHRQWRVTPETVTSYHTVISSNMRSLYAYLIIILVSISDVNIPWKFVATVATLSTGVVGSPGQLSDLALDKMHGVPSSIISLPV